MTEPTYAKIKEYTEKVFEFKEKLSTYLKSEDVKKTKTHPHVFEALNLEIEVNNDIFYYDFGNLENPTFFSEIFNRNFYGTTLSEQISDEENMYGGRCRFDMLSNKSNIIKTVTIFYKLPEDNDVLSTYIRGHEEAHAIIYCPSAKQVFEKKIFERFEVNTNKLKKEKNYHEFMAHIGGLYATKNKNYSIEEIINSLNPLNTDIKTCETISNVLKMINNK